MSETVRVEVTLAFSYDGTTDYKIVLDTNYSLEEWNELSDFQRDKELNSLIEETVWEQFTGGARVITEGAAE